MAPTTVSGRDFLAYAADMRPIFPGWRSRSGVLLALALFPAAAMVVPGRTATGAGSAVPPAELRARAAALFERRAHATREGGIPLEPLQTDMVALAAQLESAGLDSLGSDARWYAANLLSRMARRPETDQQLLYSIADAIRAHDERRTMRGRLWQADLQAQRDPPLAIRTSEAAIPRLRELGWDDLLGNAYSTEARAYTEMGRARDAFLAARAAAAHYAAARDLPGQLWAFSQCSQALRYLGRHAEARAITDSAIAMAREAHLSRPLSRALLERASIDRTRGQLPEALVAVNEALEEDHHRGDTGTSITTRIFRGRILLMMKRYRDCAADMETLLTMPQVQQTMSTLDHVAAIRARALVNLSRAEEADTLCEGVAARYERYRAGLASDEDRAGVGELAADLFATWTRVKLALGRADDAWRVGERGRGFALKTRLGIEAPPALDALEARLARSHAVLLEFDLIDPEMANVFLVTGQGAFGFALTGDISEGDLGAVLDQMSSGTAGAAPDSSAWRVSRTLLAEIWPRLGADVERLFVVPPARLEKVPFEALPDPAVTGTNTVGDRFAISYVASAAVLLALDQRSAPASGITVLADPIVDARQPAIALLEPQMRGAVLQPLPGAREEAKRLAQPGATMLLGRDATLRRLVASRPAAVLHFATHALEDAGPTARGGLVLAGVPALLTSAAIETLGVGADLVTLSGCATLGSTAYSGEGSYGLARAFLVGGSRSVITTRWDVSDRGASRFMDVLYTGLRTGQPRDQSLRQAREALIREGLPPRDCWAFMLVGVGDRPIAQWVPISGGESRPPHK